MVRLSVVDDPAVAPTGAIVDVAHPNDEARSRFGRRVQFSAPALVWTREPIADARLTFVLEEHVGWLAPPEDQPPPSDVVKQVSFLHKSAEYSLERFREHYRHHVEVARRHMHTLWQYVQYDVQAVEGSDAGIADGIVSVSVLWFRSTDDFLHRYFASPEDQAEFQAQEGFLDLPKAFSFVVTSHPSAAPAARPA